MTVYIHKFSILRNIMEGREDNNKGNGSENYSFGKLCLTSIARVCESEL